MLYDVSLPIFEGLGPFTTGGTKLRAPAAFGSTYDAWLMDFRAWSFVSGMNNRSNFWTVSLKDEVPVTRASFNTSADGANNTYQPVAIGALLGTARSQLLVDIAETGATGSLYLAPTYTFRLVG